MKDLYICRKRENNVYFVSDNSNVLEDKNLTVDEFANPKMDFSKQLTCLIKILDVNPHSFLEKEKDLDLSKFGKVDDKIYLNNLINSIREKDLNSIKILVDFYVTPCYPNVRNFLEKETNEISNFLMYLYRSDSFGGTATFANIKYTENGEESSNCDFFKLKNEDIINIIKFSIENKLKIEDIYQISKMGIGNFEDFKTKFDFSIGNGLREQILKQYSIPIGIYFILTSQKIESEIELNSCIQSYFKMSDVEKLEHLRSKMDVSNQKYLQYSYDEYNLLKQYAISSFSCIDDSKIYWPGDCQYHAGVIIDKNLALKIKDDKLLDIYFTEGLINRGPYIHEEDQDKLIAYVNVAHGDLGCREIFMKKVTKVCSKEIYQEID